MTFQEKYLALTGKFKAQVEKDNRDFKWEGKNRSEYLPNFEPNGPVDFVLVAMEPSTGVKAKAGTISSPRNFSWSVDDFIMHFCVQNYLCGDGQTYHVTDLAKGAMPTQQAKKTAKKRWPSWYKLLKKELELVTNPDAPVIAIGRQVKTFLENQKMAESPVRSIPHYSRQARVARTVAPELWPEQHRKFSKSVGIDDVKNVARKVMSGKVFDESREGIVNNLGHDLAESDKELVFTYKCLFTVMRGGSLTNMK
jgi:hypothetical protein